MKHKLLAGTRGPLDLVEVASHVMELFMEDPRVLQLICNAGQDDQAASVSIGQAAAWKRSRQQYQCLQLQHQVTTVPPINVTDLFVIKSMVIDNDIVSNETSAGQHVDCPVHCLTKDAVGCPKH